MMLWKRMRERNPDFLWAESLSQARNGRVLGKDKKRHHEGDQFSLSWFDINWAPCIPGRRTLRRQDFGTQEIDFSWNITRLVFFQKSNKVRTSSVNREFQPTEVPRPLRSSSTNDANSCSDHTAHWQPALHRVILSFILQSSPGRTWTPLFLSRWLPELKRCEIVFTHRICAISS